MKVVKLHVFKHGASYLERDTSEQILNKLRQVEVAVANGKKVAQAVRDIGVRDHTYYRWPAEHGGLNLDKMILKEVAEGNF